MAQYFDDRDIDIFFEAWLAEYPNALQEQFRILKSPSHPRNKRLVANSIGQKRKTAEKLDFYKAYKIGREFPFLDLQKDVMERIRSFYRTKELPIDPFTDDQIDQVQQNLAKIDPTFVKRSIFEMKHPFFHIAVPDADSLQKLGDVANPLDWFVEIASRESNAIYRLHTELMTKIAMDAGLVDFDEYLLERGIPQN